MKKFINLCKKPFLIGAASIFGSFLIMLIVVCAIPHGNKYSYSLNMGMFGSMDMQISFKDGKMVSDVSSAMFGDEESAEEPEPTDYKIEKGILYAVADGTSEKIGKINSFKIIIDIDDVIEEMKKEYEDSSSGTNPDESGIIYDTSEMEQSIRMLFGEELVFKCATTIALRTTSIVMVSVFGALSAACVTLLILDKKGIIKYKEVSAAEAEAELGANSTLVSVETVSDTTEEKSE